jgi:peptide/nickel transport system substrate-binding protein
MGGGGNTDNTATETTSDDTDNTTTTTPSGEMERVPEVNFVTWTQSGSPDVFEASRIIATNLEDLGLKISLDPQQFPQPIISTLFESREFDISAISYVGTAVRLDPSFYLNTVLHSDGIASGGWNFSAYESEEFDQLSDTQQSALEQEARREAVYEAQQLAYEDQAVTVYNSPDTSIGLNTQRFERPSETVPGEGLLGMYSLTRIQGKNGNSTLTLPQARNSFGAINPLTVQEAEVNEFLRPIYDTLMRVAPDGRAAPWIVNDINFEDDTTAVVTLADGLTFHDGESLTAEDVKFSFDYQRDNKAPYVFSYIEPIDSVEVVDDVTVQFNLIEPYAPFQMLTLSLVPIIPKHIWEDVEEPSEFANDPPVGSGPFEFSRRREGSLLEYDAVKDHPQAPNIDRLQLRLFGNMSSAQQALLNGDIDGIWELPTTLQSGVENNQAAELYFKPSHSIVTMVHNTRRGMPYSDRAFRRAVAYAIPNEGISNQIYGGNSGPGGSIISSANEFWHNSDVGHFAFDKEKARSTLRDAGYAWDDNDRLMMPVEE